MAAIWYIGRADVRRISAERWAEIGETGVSDTVWSQANGWSLPKAEFTEGQITILDADDNFNVMGTDGPRPGSSVIPDLFTTATRSWVTERISEFSVTPESVEAALPARLGAEALNATYDLKGVHQSVIAQIAKTQTGRFKVLLAGTSIANNSNSAARTIGEWLRTLYGAATYLNVNAGAMGGSPSNAYNGWNKQPYGGPGFIRMVSTASATPFSFYAYGDQVVIWFSIESGATAGEVLIDGVSAGMFGGPGGQAYAQSATFAMPLGSHEVKINPINGAGTYFEAIEIRDTTSKGVEVMDATLGGSSVRDMTALRAPIGAQVAGIPIVGNAGVDSYSNRPDVDLLWWEYTVNDAGAGLTHAQTLYQTTVNRAMDNASSNNIAVANIIEMGGHYADPADPLYSAFTAIVTYQRTLASRQNVAVIDWHDATIISDISTYQARYYSGDFIHPIKLGYRVLEAQFSREASIRPPTLALPSDIVAQRAYALPAGVGNDQKATIDTVVQRFPAASGAASQAIAGGASNAFQGRISPYYRKSGAYNAAASTQAAIDASATSDAWGKYIDYATWTTLNLSSTIPWSTGEKGYLTVKASGNVQLRADGDVTFFIDGNPIPKNFPGALGDRSIFYTAVGTAVQPIVITTQIGSLTNSKAAFIQGRIYEVAVTRSDVPLLV